MVLDRIYGTNAWARVSVYSPSPGFTGAMRPLWIQGDITNWKRGLDDELCVCVCVAPRLGFGLPTRRVPQLEKKSLPTIDCRRLSPEQRDLFTVLLSWSDEA